jgi:hypothetical protein
VNERAQGALIGAEFGGAGGVPPVAGYHRRNTAGANSNEPLLALLRMPSMARYAEAWMAQPGVEAR